MRDTASPVNVTLDNTNPSQTLALNSVSQSGGLDQAFKNGTTVYYRGTTAGSFKVRSSVDGRRLGPGVGDIRRARRNDDRLDVHRLDRHDSRRRDL